MTRLLSIVTGGAGDARRVRRLTRDLPVEHRVHELDRVRPRWENARGVWRLLREGSWDLVLLEGTGIAAGANLIRAAQAWGQPYLVSSGDPIAGFFHTTRGPLVGAAFGVYERLLYRHCVGFIGWTPYLTGMALQLGAPRGVTVEGAADLQVFRPLDPDQRLAVRRELGLPPEHLVCGVAGSLRWTKRQGYCYGLELVSLLPHLRREDLSVLIVGDGDGRARLEAALPPRLRRRAVFTGRVSESEVARALGCIDVGFIAQTLDGLGRYRLTAKLPECLAAGLPVAMSPIPGFYDYAAPAGWALPALHPADPAMHRACARWLDGLTREEVQAKAARARALAEAHFDYALLRSRFGAFVEGVLAELPG